MWRCLPSNRQLDLFAKFDEAKSGRLMSMLDKVNSRFGTGALKLAISGGHVAENAAMRRDRKSPNYTTSWNEIQLAK